jgi:hypothetical protein
VLWTVAAVTVTRRLDLTPPVLAVEARLAVGLAAVMATITAATAVWWAALAADAPWFLHGTVAGRPSSAFDPRLALTMLVMLAAATAALLGRDRRGAGAAGAARRVNQAASSTRP